MNFRPTYTGIIASFSKVFVGGHSPACLVQNSERSLCSTRISYLRTIVAELAIAPGVIDSKFHFRWLTSPRDTSFFPSLNAVTAVQPRVSAT
jgi:hypothetical protein